MSTKALPLLALACALSFTFVTPKALALDNLDSSLTKLTFDQRINDIKSPFMLIDDDDDRWDDDDDDRWDDDDDDDRWERRRPRRGDRWDDDDDDDDWDDWDEYD